jgi:hypothetical protein
MPDIESDHALTKVEDQRQLVDQITYQLRYEKAEQARSSGLILAALAVFSFCFAFGVFSLYSADMRDRYNYERSRLGSTDEAMSLAFDRLNDIYDTAKVILSADVPQEKTVTTSDGSKNKPFETEDDKDARIVQLTAALKSVQQLSVSVSDELNRVPRIVPRKPITPSFSLSVIGTAHADQMAPKTLVPRPIPERAQSAKATVLANLFWFLLLAPAFGCVAGFFCIFNRKKDLVAFGTNLVTSILGYYFGAGVTVLTAMLA